jgi:hypothetical protein
VNVRRPGISAHVRIARLALAVALLGSGCAYTLVRGGTVDKGEAEQITRKLETLRHLKFKTPVPVTVTTPEQAQQMIAAELERNFSDEQLQVDGIAGSLIGLYPAGINLKAEYLRLMQSQLAGFYDTQGKQMVLVEGAVPQGVLGSIASFLAQRDFVGEMVLAHELTHALQDQHFDLDKTFDADKGDSDRTLALKAVEEGDAMLAGFGVLLGRMDASTSETLGSRMGALPAEFAKESLGTPEALSDPLIFQYSDGTRFVAEAYRRGRWKGVDALYANPPQSTQQILMPSLYFDRPATPAIVTVAGYEEILPGWTKADEDTYGELLIRVIIKRHYGEGAPELLSVRRWAGDRIIVLRKGDSVGVLWLLAFRDGDAAARFAAVYATILDRLHGGRTPHDIEYRGNLVLIAAGGPALSFGDLAPSVLRQSKVERSALPPARAKAGSALGATAPASPR